MSILAGSVTKKIVSFDGTEIFYNYIKGTKKDKWLIFLHGLGGDLTAWDKERIAIKALGYSTLAIDLRGHGLSKRPKIEEAYDLNNFVKDVLVILDEEKIQKPVLVGHCLGGMISLTLEGTHPKTSQGLILVDTSYKPPYLVNILSDHAVLNKIVHLLANHIPAIGIYKHVDFSKFVGTTDLDPKRILSDVLHTSLKSYLLICEDLIGYDASELLKRIVVPTLVIEGTEDIIFPPKVARDLGHRIKKAQVDFIQGANHILVINNPEDVVLEIHTFLKKIQF